MGIYMAAQGKKVVMVIAHENFRDRRRNLGPHDDLVFGADDSVNRLFERQCADPGLDRLDQGWPRRARRLVRAPAARDRNQKRHDQTTNERGPDAVLSSRCL